MINKDRIVPITAVDLISMYGLILLQDSNNSGLTALDAKTTDGRFVLGDLPIASESGDLPIASKSGELLIASEPVKTFELAGYEDNVTVYFVPAYDYAGFTVNGEALPSGEVSGEVEADGRTLYKAVIALGDGITITKVGF